MGILASQSTLKIAVWSSIILHIAGFLGFELAFSNKGESFPKSEPRTITVVSICSESNSVSTPLRQVQNSVNEQILEETVSKEPVRVPDKEKIPGAIFKEISPAELVSDNIDSTIQEEKTSSFKNHVITGESEFGEKNVQFTEAIPVKSIEPVYPFRARKKGLEGVVILNVTISKSGEPLFCSIADSSGYKDLDDAALDTVLSSFFQPGTINGEKIESSLRISIKFQLNKS